MKDSFDYFGILKYRLFLLIALLLIGCACGISPEADEEIENTTVPVIASTPRIPLLALGDSYPIGHNRVETERLPEQLTVKLQKMGVETEIEIIACACWTINNLLVSLSTNLS